MLNGGFVALLFYSIKEEHYKYIIEETSFEMTGFGSVIRFLVS